MHAPVRYRSIRPCNLLFMLGIFAAVLLLVIPVAAETGVTITSLKDRSWYAGEVIVLYGDNSRSDTTFLFIKGPGLPENGGNLASPREPVVTDDFTTFTVAPATLVNGWGYDMYTSSLLTEPGLYTIYATSQPKAWNDLAGIPYSQLEIVLKKPFITAEIINSTVTRGRPFTITGSAEGDPENVQLFLFGDHYLFNTMIPVHSDSSFTYTVDSAIAGDLPAGDWYLVLLHPMQDYRHNIVLNGDHIRTGGYNAETQENRSGEFLVKGKDAAYGKSAALNLVTNIDDRYIDDTYLLIPFAITSPGRESDPNGDTPAFVPPAPGIMAAAATQPAPGQTQAAPLRYAPVAALVIAGIAVWCRNRGSA